MGPTGGEKGRLYVRFTTYPKCTKMNGIRRKLKNTHRKKRKREIVQAIVWEEVFRKTKYSRFRMPRYSISPPAAEKEVHQKKIESKHFFREGGGKKKVKNPGGKR